MKKRIVRLFSLFLMTALLVSATPVYGSGTDLIRIGLYYADNALTSANLQNSDGYGQGFRFGYYAGDLSFVELGRTDSSISTISVLRASTTYRSGSNYSLSDNGGEVIGCYHIGVASGLASFDEACQLANSYSGGFVAWINGQYEVRVGAYLTKDDALAAQASQGLEGTICATSNYAMNVVQTGSSQIMFQYDGGSGSALGIYPDVTGVEEPRVWFKGYRYTGGFRYARLDGENISVTTVIDLETYVKGVIPYEMNNSWPLEALKAQAVCARTYAQMGINSSKHKTFELCNSTCCQVYRGLGSNSSSYQATAVTDQAVEETDGMMLWYNDELAKTYYSSSHGGASEDIANIWGGSSTNTPYLQGVVDPYEHLVSDLNAYSNWTRTYSSSQILSMLQGDGYGIGTNLDGIEAIYSPTGNVIDLKFHFTNGKTVTFSPEVMRYSSKLALPSIHFTINGNTVVQDQEQGSVTEPSTSTTVTANEGSLLSKILYTINGSRTLKKLSTSTDCYVITGDGTVEEINLGSTTPTVPDVNVDSSVDLSGTTYTQASTYTFEGGGWGHQIGFSQWGAYAMAEKVNMTYDQIVTFYFPGTYVATKG